jgi:hypothetical protein
VLLRKAVAPRKALAAQPVAVQAAEREEVEELAVAATP